MRQPHAVARPVSDGGRADPPEICQDELAFTRRSGRHRVDHLGDELRLVDVEPAPLDALVAIGAHLGHAAVVVSSGAPGPLDTGAHRRNPGARLARVHRDPHRQPPQVDTALARDLGQVKGVGRRADEDRRTEGFHRGQPRRRVLAAAGDRQRSEHPGALEAGPEPDEEPERERKEDAVRGPHARAPQNDPPAARPPFPRFLRVEPYERRAARARGLVHANVALERVGQVRTEGRVRSLIVDQLRLSRQGHPPEVVPAAQILY